jgi:hypothetical protein
MNASKISARLKTAWQLSIGQSIIPAFFAMNSKLLSCSVVKEG